MATENNYAPSCMDDFDPDSLDATQALQQILNTITCHADIELLPIRDALGRTLAEDISASINVPGHTNSAMDGYAIKAIDIPTQGQTSLDNIGTAWAGRPYPDKVNSGECVRIMTGCLMVAIP